MLSILLQVSQDMGTEAPIPISTKLGDFNNVFRKIVSAAEHPHLSIPETEAGKSRKQYLRLINRSLMFASGIVSFICPLMYGFFESFVGLLASFVSESISSLLGGFC